MAFQGPQLELHPQHNHHHDQTPSNVSLPCSKPPKSTHPIKPHPALPYNHAPTMAPALSTLYTLSFSLALLLTLLVAASLRLLAILRPTPPRHRLGFRPPRARILVVLGSGGHTHEMLALLRDLDTRKYAHRTYVVSRGDAFSAGRAVGFERGLEERWAGRRKSERRGEGEGCVGPEFYSIATIPRARRVHQSLYSTPFSALRSLVAAFKPLLSVPASSPSSPLPTLIITNGPATAVLVVLASLILRFFNVRGAESSGLCRTVYVESFARVKTLSLSGRLLVRVVDRFLVQWEELEGYAGRAEFGGILV